MSAVAPSPGALVFRIKSGRTTTFVYALPTTPLPAVREQLYSLLQENASNLSVELPEAGADAIVLGVPKDQAELGRGFLPLVEDAKGKRKATVEDAGLGKDTPVLVWKVKGEQFEVELPREEEEGEEEMEASD